MPFERKQGLPAFALDEDIFLVTSIEIIRSYSQSLRCFFDASLLFVRTNTVYVRTRSFQLAVGENRVQFACKAGKLVGRISFSMRRNTASSSGRRDWDFASLAATPCSSSRFSSPACFSRRRSASC